MSGTKEGGLKAAVTNKASYGQDFYVRVGRAGGRVSHPETRAFSTHRDLANAAGRVGGMVSKRNAKNFFPVDRRSKEILKAYKHLKKIQDKVKKDREAIKKELSRYQKIDKGYYM